MNNQEKLAQYKELLDQGIISQEEYDAKAAILGAEAAAAPQPEAVQPEIIQPEAVQPEIIQPEAAQALEDGWQPVQDSVQSNGDWQQTDVPTPPAQGGYTYGNGEYAYTEQEAVKDSGSIGWGLLAFFIPIVGIILYFVNRGKKPKTAKVCLYGALISIGINVIATIITNLGSGM